MLERHEYKGLWWLPSDEETKLSGTLTVTRGEAELELLHHFGHKLVSEGKKQKAFSFSLEERPRIVGMTTTGDAITLEGGGLASPTLHSPGIATSTYRPPWVLVGRAFAEGEEIGFDEIAVQMSDLDTWSFVSGFSRPHIAPGEPEAGLKGLFDIQFERPPAIEIPLDDGEYAQIEFAPGHSGWGAVTTSITVSQTAWLRLRFAQRHSLNHVAKRVGQLRNFLCLAVGRPVAVLSVTGFDGSYRRDSDRPIPIQLLWGIPHNPEQPTQELVRPGFRAGLFSWFLL